MLTIGVDPHKRTHSAVAVDQVGTEVSGVTESAARDGFGALLRWSRSLPDPKRVWVIEDCRHVSGRFERFLLDRGETTVRLSATAYGKRARGGSRAWEVRSDRCSGHRAHGSA